LIWGGGEGGEARKWRRKLWAWEEELVEECRTLLLTVSLQVDTVRGAYHTLADGMPLHHDASVLYEDLLWRKDVPLKISIFAWRLFRNRLPTKVNLFRRGLFDWRIRCVLLVVVCTRLMSIYS